jgi:hypothetical protein
MYQYSEPLYRYIERMYQCSKPLLRYSEWMYQYSEPLYQRDETFQRRLWSAKRFEGGVPAEALKAKRNSSWLAGAFPEPTS